jgi:hypothetical protein
MPLDPLQERIARTALNLPEAHTLALAGGGAMIAHGFVGRSTKDIDLFTEIDDDEAVNVVVALRRALSEQNLDIREAERPPLDHRFVVKDTGFTVETFLDALRAMDRLRPAEWQEDGISIEDAERLTVLFTEWRSQLTPKPVD